MAKPSPRKPGDPLPGAGPLEDFRKGDVRCLRCGAAFATRKELDEHTEAGHSLQA